MRYKHLSLVVVGSMLFLQCANKVKVAYTIPEDYPEARKKQLAEILEKGQKLYKVNCSDCHGIFTKGKDNVPNFTTTQLDNYSSRFLRRDPKNHAVFTNMSQDQLNQVLTFLRFKKTKKTDTSAKGPAL